MLFKSLMLISFFFVQNQAMSQIRYQQLMSIDTNCYTFLHEPFKINIDMHI